MERTYYGFNTSQDIIHLQTKYTLFKRVANIVFTTVVENGFDRALMTDAINKVIERNDCLRITFARKDGQIVQYFEPQREIGRIRQVEFTKAKQFDEFIRKFRRGKIDPFKGETLKVVFARNHDGSDVIIYKISHYVADTYGIGVLLTDIFAVYNALKKGDALPPAPGSFEEVLKKELPGKNDKEARGRDRQFFENYYRNVHSEPPLYCGLHGDNCDFWLKSRRKGNFGVPFIFINCDTEGYMSVIPSTITRMAMEWCEKSQITLSTFFFYTFSIACSLLNGKARHQAPLMLLDNRATALERKCAGTKVQSIGLYTTVDYEMTFNEAVAAEFSEQTEQYRHTKLSYTEVQDMQHEVWGHSQLIQTTNFCYSFIPFKAPEGVTMQVQSNGKGALPAYVALMFDVDTQEIRCVYDVQKVMMTAATLMDFQNTYVRVIEKVLANPDVKMKEIL